MPEATGPSPAIPSPPAGSAGKVDGRIVVILLFAGAFLLWGIVFLAGLNQRGSRGQLPGREDGAYRDSSAHPDTLRAWLAKLPAEWVKVTRVEGQGFVILVPCYTSNSELAFRTEPDSLPRLQCEYCDSLGQYGVLGIARDHRDTTLELQLNPPAGELKVLAVTDSLLARYPEAPFQDRILVWSRPRRVEGGAAPDSAAADDSTGVQPTAQVAATPAADTLIFVPRHQENEFEVLRAEDENPEGCGTQAE